MNPKTQRYVLGTLVVLLLLVYFFNRSSSGNAPAAAPDAKFEPLKVEDPALRVYELDTVRKAEYKGADHNIFVYGPPRPSPAEVAKKVAEENRHKVYGPPPPPPIPPLVVPATFFGYATNPKTMNRLAFFSTPDDVFIVGEGGMLMNRFERDTVVYPGHMGVTTLGREWDTNPFLAELRAAAMSPVPAQTGTRESR